MARYKLPPQVRNKIAACYKGFTLSIKCVEFTCITHSMRYSCAIGSLQFTACSSTPGKTPCKDKDQLIKVINQRAKQGKHLMTVI